MYISPANNAELREENILLIQGGDEFILANPVFVLEYIILLQ